MNRIFTAIAAVLILLLALGGQILCAQFDDAGNWKRVETHRMTDKEIERSSSGDGLTQLK